MRTINFLLKSRRKSFIRKVHEKKKINKQYHLFTIKCERLAIISLHIKYCIQIIFLFFRITQMSLNFIHTHSSELFFFNFLNSKETSHDSYTLKCFLNKLEIKIKCFFLYSN